jgi:hypothetical protein
VYRTGTETELPTARLADHVDVEGIKAIITIESDPHKAHVGSGVIDMNLGYSSRLKELYSERRLSIGFKTGHL